MLRLLTPVLRFEPGSLALPAPGSQASLRHLVGGLIGLAMSILCFREYIPFPAACTLRTVPRHCCCPRPAFAPKCCSFSAAWSCLPPLPAPSADDDASSCIPCRETIHLWAHMLYAWAMMRLGGSRQHLFVFWGCMLHLFGVYMYHRTYYWGDYSLNIAGPLMILTQKMTQVAFAVHDGQRDPQTVNAFCRPHALQKAPSLLEMFGHTFFFPSLLAGPNHHFHVYRDTIEGTGPNSKPVNGVLPGLKKLGVALGIYVITLLPGIIFGTPEIKPHRVVAGPMYNGEPNPVHEVSHTPDLAGLLQPAAAHLSQIDARRGAVTDGDPTRPLHALDGSIPSPASCYTTSWRCSSIAVASTLHGISVSAQRTVCTSWPRLQRGCLLRTARACRRSLTAGATSLPILLAACIGSRGGLQCL